MDHKFEEQQKQALDIAIDYDDTITLDKAMFREIFEVIKRHGHNAYIVTMRNESWGEEVRDENWGVPVICTDCAAKEVYCIENYGLEFDFVMDDKPKYWVEHHRNSLKITGGWNAE